MRSKNEEMEMLKRWQAEAQEEPGSYLASFLTDGLLEYVSGQLAADELPDIWAELNEMDKRIVAANQRYIDARHEIEDLRHRNRQLEVECLAAESEMNYLHKDIANLEQELAIWTQVKWVLAAVIEKVTSPLANESAEPKKMLTEYMR